MEQTSIAEVEQAIVKNLQDIVSVLQADVDRLTQELKFKKKALKRRRTQLAKETGEKPVKVVKARRKAA